MNQTTRRISRAAGLSGFALAFAVTALAAPAGALAKGGGGRVVTRSGACTIASTAKLKAKNEDGRIGVEFEVDQNRNNRLWNIKVWDDGHRVFTGSRRTKAPSGSFSLEIIIPNRAGTDTIKAQATNPSTGERCTLTLNY